MARFLVVGGGIGGLATALSLSRHGHEAVVLERNDTFAELGAGIQLAANGIRALDELGLGAPVRARARAIDHLRFMDGVSGEHVTSMPLTETYRRRFGNPYVVVHRGELHRMLHDAVRATGRVELRAQQHVTGYHRDEGSATAVLETGERVTGDVLIGADGVRSAVRRQLVGDGDPRNSGITVYRSLVPIERVPPELRWNAVTWWAGPGCHFVHYAIAGGRFLNMAASFDDRATRVVSGVPVPAATVRGLFTALAEAPRRLLALGADWRAWVLIDRPPVQDWTDGRVALLGDAAHPMLHYAAQGACQALEDAVVLGALSAGRTDGFAPMLREYNAHRRERTAAVQRVSLESIRLWHPVGPAAHARNARLAALTSDELHDHVAWMHHIPKFSRILESSESGRTP
ncbi:FAD-dependent oxidoreductase [Mangrovihabitans endophyticus]|uniref:Putative monooxygenase (salicylate/ hydroxybenzoate hydroxylase) n=1 Tax=Mangrovihabitans endophyticus TaxID=1751298 RepID=A0A8J3FM85_9ACTN|nr:FAD-dependent oxidoreductase [Mangrovihabitans endophyticus]GGK73937.1 putative monooxygenase (salicylate/ hydroxybenzoate hydroxylase [Mangrovihabitans endophyticus]